ncbi:triose-phosphate isomerase [Myxococcota bacterium]|nr:triose-phosphate isomerase [Myxococcota bacterium]MBU1380236.1 triose-phosphate isomerase [Myxococcota bacterium]MBU1499102.1 triose-phosphate isomerase [Myxococcota bacterium]
MSDLRTIIEQLVRQTLQEMAPSSSDIKPMKAVSQTINSSHNYGKRLPLVAANWKMNQLSGSAKAFMREIQLKDRKNIQTLICAPHILLPVLAGEKKETDILLGAQNFYPEPSGAFTGEHSLDMLIDVGVQSVIIGHSERRNLFGETDELLAKKLAYAVDKKFLPIFCIGENLKERNDGSTFRVLQNQILTGFAGLKNPLPDPAMIVVAYEPIWAIGTGLTATAEQAQDAIAFVREKLADRFSWAYANSIRILYGGSANDKNAATLAAKPDIDGFLVGNASLNATTFASMIEQVAAVKRKVFAS